MEKQLFINWMLNPAHRMTLTYVISLTIIAALSIFVHFTLDKIIIEQIVSGKLINVSGQQRMLSQRTVLYTNEYIARGVVTDKKKALFALNKMNKNYHYLLKEHFEKLKQNQVSPLSEPMSALYFSEPHNIARKMTEFSSLINQILDRPRSSIDTQSNLEGSIFLFMAKEQILNSFNITVKLYEVESNQQIHELRTTQQLLLIIIILTILIECLFFITPLSIKSNRYSKSLYEEANHDYLTNLLNRRSFAVLAKQFVAISKRYHSDLSVISFDIDLFKSINDKYGHDLGDKVIQNVAGTIQENCRDSDSVFRFGGEEFLILLPKTSMSEAIKLAEKIRSTITNSPTLADKLIIEVTASAGVSQWDSEEKNIESALKRADDALYQAKKQGRDRVVAG
ncbi:diguanylate cyclase [uncultured Paraglaciecola sp.]|uniref:diguanylate cyclase n=1 Tax=uncultured Paraglaciecola sp. TaxID=1765024 RepID=UPI0025DDF653|nr:diguanylate cyclase [uncultured Paraglaciecola sp.]